MTLPRLSADLLRDRGEAVPDLPVRAVQFGTGALLRGLVDDALDQAARAGDWSGSAVVVSQTGSGRGAAFNEQDGLFTLRVRGIEGGEPVDEARVVGAVARALSAQDDWDAVLALARDPAVDLVVSNTTEVGLTWDDSDDSEAAPPASFPAKLAAVLKARLDALGPEADLVVLPTELVEGNGDVLRDLVLRWGARAGWGEPFAAFVGACRFANTLVDRIVTGTPPDLPAAEAAVGHRDPLMTDTEVYRLWAIEGDGALRDRLGFATGDASSGAGIVVAGDIEPFRLRKVRLLNAAHTLLVPVALGCGLATVREAVTDDRLGAYVRGLMADELILAVASDLDAMGAEPATAAPFAAAVLDRFANPFIRHELASITLQQTMKLGVRAVPSVAALDREGRSADAIALGFAAFLLLHRAADGLPAGDSPLEFTTTRLLTDDRAEAVRARWRHRPDGAEAVARDVLADAALWGRDLTALPRSGSAFADAVARLTARALDDGLPAVVDAHLALATR
ncbi:MAG: tagaturonate reductase [Bacteroidota bacterium]